MGVNLTDWLGDHLWALWLSLAFLLAIAEMLSLDFVLIMLAAGALAAAGTAALAPGLWWLQIIVAVVVSVGTLAILRPTLIKQGPGHAGLPVVDGQDGRQQRPGDCRRSPPTGARSRSTARPGRPGR